MEIIIRGTPEECKKAIKELAEKDKEYVPIYPSYPEVWKWYPSWYYYPITVADKTGSITGITTTYSAKSISADDIKVSNNISAIINDATLDCFAKSVPTK